MNRRAFLAVFVAATLRCGFGLSLVQEEPNTVTFEVTGLVPGDSIAIYSNVNGQRGELLYRKKGPMKASTVTILKPPTTDVWIVSRRIRNYPLS